MKNKEFDNILNECLERLLKGETLEQCLQSYPEQAAELKPLLETALVAQKASAIQPRADFKARARYQFQSALQEVATSKRRPFFGWFPRWVTVVTAVLIFLLAGGGTVAAAADSMPDDALYPVKLATEQVQLTLTFSPMDKASLCAELADRRVTEIIYMANKGDAGQVELVTQRLNERLELLVFLVGGGDGGARETLMVPSTTFPAEEAAPAPAAVPQPGKSWGGSDDSAQFDSRARLRMTVMRYASDNSMELHALLEEAPASAKPALRRAIAISEAGYQKALEALDSP